MTIRHLDQINVARFRVAKDDPANAAFMAALDHVNAMADAVAHFIRRIGRENIAEGDVYITNNPWEGTGHLHDITVVTPVFHGHDGHKAVAETTALEAAE